MYTHTYTYIHQCICIYAYTKRRVEHPAVKRYGTAWMETEECIAAHHGMVTLYFCRVCVCIYIYIYIHIYTYNIHDNVSNTN